MNQDWATDVVTFWFAELAPSHWFKRDETLDELIRGRFLDLHEAVAASPIEVLADTAQTALGGIVALDQFPRNMFRGSPRAFATDAHALALAARAVDRGYDEQLSVDRRLFLYLPFEHSEDAACQKRSFALISTLGNERYTRSAIDHQMIIDRFGRFPHRNAVLGRASTSAEIEFLAEPGSAF